MQSITIPSQILLSAAATPAFVAQFSFFVGLLLSWTILGGNFFKKIFKLPVIAGQIIAGIILGPSVINVAKFSFFAQPIRFFDATTNTTYSIATFDTLLFVVILLSSALTIAYLLWLAGHETDLQDIASVGPVALIAGVLGAILPIAMIAVPLYYCFSYDWNMIQSIGMGLVFAATSVSIPVAMLMSYNKMHLKSSKAALGAAVVDDVFAVILLSLFFLAMQAGLFGKVSGIESGGHDVSVSGALFSMFSAIITMGIIGYYVLRPLITWLIRKQQFHLIAPLAHVGTFFYFAFAEIFGGLAGITGSYFAGLFHRMSDVDHTAQKAIAPFVESLLLPLFLGSIGLQLDMSLLSLFDWVLVVILLFLAVISKLISCFVAVYTMQSVTGTKMDRWSFLETYLFGSSMVARGEVGLVVSTILFGSSIIAMHQYVVAVVVIVLTTVVTPIMLEIGFQKESAH